MIMLNGFYKELDELKEKEKCAGFGFLKNLDIGDETAYRYLHGDCADFAAMLNEVYGYPIECVRHPDDDNVRGKLIHAYCVADFNGEKAYIDVRGITTDPKRFWEEFENELTYFPKDGSIYTVDDEGYEVSAELEIWENKDVLFDGDYEGWTDEEIKKFIFDYGDYYDIEKTIEKTVDKSQLQENQKYDLSSDKIVYQGGDFHLYASNREAAGVLYKGKIFTEYLHVDALAEAMREIDNIEMHVEDYPNEIKMNSIYLYHGDIKNPIDYIATFAVYEEYLLCYFEKQLEDNFEVFKEYANEKGVKIACQIDGFNNLYKEVNIEATEKEIGKGEDKMREENDLVTEKLELNEKYGEDCVLKLCEKGKEEEYVPEMEYGTILECLKAASEKLDLDDNQYFSLVTEEESYIAASYEELCSKIEIDPARVESLFNASYEGPNVDQKKYFAYDAPYGETETVSIECAMYEDNNNLYIGLSYFDKEMGEMDYYGDVTVNILTLPYLHAALDTNNMNKEKLLSFLKENGFGELTGNALPSGYCMYPIFKFSEEKLREVCAEAFLEYQQAHGKEPMPSLSNQIEEAEKTKKETESNQSELDRDLEER